MFSTFRKAALATVVQFLLLGALAAEARAAPSLCDAIAGNLVANPAPAWCREAGCGRRVDAPTLSPARLRFCPRGLSGWAGASVACRPFNSIRSGPAARAAGSGRAASISERFMNARRREARSA